MADAKITARDGDMLDYLCWKHYGSSSGYVEFILEHRSNYRLSDLPELLSAGTVVNMPEHTVQLAPLKLWDD